jgi:hypothetical protein
VGGGVASAGAGVAEGRVAGAAGELDAGRLAVPDGVPLQPTLRAATAVRTSQRITPNVAVLASFGAIERARARFGRSSR